MRADDCGHDRQAKSAAAGFPGPGCVRTVEALEDPGRFVLRDAHITFSELTFGVPGAVVQLSGTYGLRDELIDFKGFFLADATLADMTSGFKAMLARIAQPFFSRPGGGSKIPIRISGPRSNPTFGLDVRRVFNRG